VLGVAVVEERVVVADVRCCVFGEEMAGVGCVKFV
jgi:hypothetical protein